MLEIRSQLASQCAKGNYSVYQDQHYNLELPFLITLPASIFTDLFYICLDYKTFIFEIIYLKL